jgi:hypothetical protein
MGVIRPLAVAISVAMLFASCSRGSDPVVMEEPTAVPAAGVVTEEYFPTGVGTRWDYEIQTFHSRPLTYRQLVFPLAGNQVDTIGYSHDHPEAGPGKRFALSLVVKGSVPAHERAADARLFREYGTPTEFVELEVLRDELRMYALEKRLFWAIIRESDDRRAFHMEQRARYTQDIGEGILDPVADGWSRRMVFLGARSGIQIQAAESPLEGLVYVGPDRNVPGYEGEELHRFRRLVEARANSYRSLHYDENAFTEDMWFAKGKGMVRLEQKVLGETTMVWTLTSFVGGVNPQQSTTETPPLARRASPSASPGPTRASTPPRGSPSATATPRRSGTASSEFTTTGGRYQITRIETKQQYPDNCGSGTAQCSTPKPGHELLLLVLKADAGENRFRGLIAPCFVEKSLYVVGSDNIKAECLVAASGSDPSEAHLVFEVRTGTRGFTLHIPNQGPISLGR